MAESAEHHDERARSSMVSTQASRLARE